MDDFIRAFGGENEETIVSPGSYVQFFVVAASATASTPQWQLPAATLGTLESDEVDDEPRSSDGSSSPDAEFELITGHFGALSSNGLFLESVSRVPDGVEQQDARDSTMDRDFCTKIDVPRTFIRH